MINETVNKSGETHKEARTQHRAPYVAASPHDLMRQEPGITQKRREIKSIPFSGLLTNKLLAGLPGEDFARLLPHLEPVSLSYGDYLYEMGETVDYCYLPESAVVSQIHLLEDGSTTEVALVGNEGMVGLSAIFGAAAPAYWSETLVAGSALRIRAGVLKEEFGRGQAWQRLLLAYTSARLAHLSQRAICNGRHSLAGRLCSWLLMIDDRMENGQLVLTHEEMARHLGTRRASVSVVATELRKRGAISYNRGKLCILDRQLLEAFACECYRALARQPVDVRSGSNR